MVRYISQMLFCQMRLKENKNRKQTMNERDKEQFIYFLHPLRLCLPFRLLPLQQKECLKCIKKKLPKCNESPENRHS